MPVHQDGGHVGQGSHAPQGDGAGESFPAANIIVIHPGSLYVRIGRATDPAPVERAHCVARRRRPGGLYRRDPLLPPLAPIPADGPPDEAEECRRRVSRALRAKARAVRGEAARRPPPRETAARIEPIRTAKDDGRDRIVGDEALRLDPDAPYNLHFPYRRGDLNVHSGVGGSATSALADAVDVWTDVIERDLGIRPEELRRHRCALLVPDVYDRSHLRRLAGALLEDAGFSRCFLVQESVAAAFGAGCGSACVVDVGDQKTSVSCVEDGASRKTTRLRMDYGAGDACQALRRLLAEAADEAGAAPPPDWDDRRPEDAAVARRLYEEFCRADADGADPAETTVLVPRPGAPRETAAVRLGDERTVAPLSLFHPELLSATGPKSARAQPAPAGDPEDPFDADYLRETGRRRDAAEAGPAAADGAANDGPPPPPAEDDVAADAPEVPPDGAPAAPGRALGLDAAVLQSVERCPGDDLKRKMFGCVLVVGGGARTRGLAERLRGRLAAQIPPALRPEQAEPAVAPKDADPATTAWRGAAVMARLESANELWISRAEWRRHGVKVLRERSPFVW